MSFIFWEFDLRDFLIKALLYVVASIIVIYVIAKIRNFLKRLKTERDFITKTDSDENMKKIFIDDSVVSEVNDSVSNELRNPLKEKFRESAYSSSSNIVKQASSLNNKAFTRVEKESNLVDILGESNNKESSRKEFNLIIKQILSLVKELQFAYSVAIFWVNRDKQQLVLESYVTDSKKFINNKRLPITSDVVSQIAVYGRSRIVNYVDTLGQTEILPYYTASEPVKTFAGIPIFYDNTPEPIAVLILDCLETDAYGEETLASLTHVTKLISAILQSYTAKYDLLLDSETLRAIDKLHEQLAIDFSTHSISRTLADEISKLVVWDYIAIVLYDDNRKSWVVYYLLNRLNDAYVPIMKELDYKKSLVVSVIQAGIPKMVDDVASLEIPRFFESERCESKGSLMIVPLNSLKKCYGAIVVESKDIKAYSDKDVKLIEKLSNIASCTFEILGLTEVINNHIALDETTGVNTRKSFMSRLIEEVQRAKDFSTDLSLAMISIDKVDDQINRYGRDAFDIILQSVAHLIKASVRVYDVVGRIDFNCFAILLLNTTTNEASLWAEKMRKNIASNILDINNKTFSVTASIGVAGATHSASDLELVENANRVLRKAIEAGGNIVRVY